MAIGNVISELRYDRNLSQKKLADAIGVSQSTIAQIETNRNEATASTIRKLADFFEVSANYLLELENDFGEVSIKKQIPQLTAEEQMIISDFRELSPNCKKLVKDTIKMLLTSSGTAQNKIS